LEYLISKSKTKYTRGLPVQYEAFSGTNLALQPGLSTNKEVIMYNYVRIIIKCKNWLNNKSSTTGATSGAGTAYLSGTHEFTPGFSGVSVIQSLVFCVLFCRYLLN